jgi:hypothetical protein
MNSLHSPSSLTHPLTQVDSVGVAPRYQSGPIGEIPPVGNKVGGNTKLGGTAGSICSRPCVDEGIFVLEDNS